MPVKLRWFPVARSFVSKKKIPAVKGFYRNSSLSNPPQLNMSDEEVVGFCNFCGEEDCPGCVPADEEEIEESPPARTLKRQNAMIDLTGAPEDEGLYEACPYPYSNYYYHRGYL